MSCIDSIVKKYKLLTTFEAFSSQICAPSPHMGINTLLAVSCLFLFLYPQTCTSVVCDFCPLLLIKETLKRSFLFFILSWLFFKN